MALDLKNIDVQQLSGQLESALNDPNNLGSAPLWIRILLIVILCGGLGYGGYKYFPSIEDRLAQLDEVEAEEGDLRNEFENKQKKAASLPAYREQLQEMEQSFGTLLRQLPAKTEVDSLLVDISQTALASGLEIQVFQPRGENQKGFYAELPIRIQVVGNYHEVGTFISGVAALPRIVTISNINLSPTGGGNQANQGRPDLNMRVQAQTYRYLGEGG